MCILYLGLIRVVPRVLGLELDLPPIQVEIHALQCDQHCPACALPVQEYDAKHKEYEICGLRGRLVRLLDDLASVQRGSR